jgi:putative transposase
MKKKRHTPEQIIRLLREQETSGKTIVEFCREKGFTEQTYHRWKKLYMGMDERAARELRELRVENARPMSSRC